MTNDKRGWNRPTDFAVRRDIDRVSDRLVKMNDQAQRKREVIAGRVRALEARLVLCEKIIQEILSLRK